jgi:integrase
MAKVIFVLKEPNGENPTLIYLLFSYSHTITDSTGKKKYKFIKISTSEKVHPDFWKDRPYYRVKKTPSFPEYAEMNARLDFLESTINTAYRRLVNDGNSNPTPEMIKDEYEKMIGKREKEVKVGVIPFIERQISESKALRSENTIKKYNTTLKHLKDYSDSRGIWLEFKDINMRFYSDFHQYLVIENNFTDNTFGKYIATLKAFLNTATEQGLNESKDYKSRRFKVLKEDVDKIYLTIDELNNIYKLDLRDNKKLERVRDMFVMECYLGLRFSDIGTLSSENIYTTDQGQFIKIRTKKTEEVVICPMHPIVKKIFKKYDNDLPKPISNQKTNDYLKIIGRKAKITDEVKVTKTIGGKVDTTIQNKCDLITTHTARRSFASNAYLAGLPAISIMKITGHRTEQSFLRYIRITPEENAMKLLDHPFFKPKPIRRQPAKPLPSKSPRKRIKK